MGTGSQTRSIPGATALPETVVLLLKNVSRTPQAPSKCSKTTKTTMNTLVDNDFP
ncbi:hypothetical protein OH686_09705 [Pseudomonas sp. SO81]|nr:hypothetical protein OH686_09705 [Pseudomonas sp. SO81]